MRAKIKGGIKTPNHRSTKPAPINRCLQNLICVRIHCWLANLLLNQLSQQIDIVCVRETRAGVNLQTGEGIVVS